LPRDLFRPDRRGGECQQQGDDREFPEHVSLRGHATNAGPQRASFRSETGGRTPSTPSERRRSTRSRRAQKRGGAREWLTARDASPNGGDSVIETRPVGSASTAASRWTPAAPVYATRIVCRMSSRPSASKSPDVQGSGVGCA